MGRGRWHLLSPGVSGDRFFEVHRVTVFFQTKAWREGWPHVARVPTPLCGPWTQTSLPAHRSWAAGLRGSDGEGDEAVVALDVPLEDLGAGAQHALKAGPVQLDTLEGPSGHHGGRPGPVQQQRDLPWGARGWSGARPTGLPALLSSTGFQQARPGEHRHTVSHPSAATPTPQGLGELGVRGHALPGAAASRTHPSRAPQPAPRIPPMALHLSALPGTPPHHATHTL